MASAPINKVQDKNGDQFFPITHQQAVINDNGDDLTTILAGKLTGVTFNGVTAPVSSGVAAISASIPAAPGTLNTNNTTAQTASSSEALSGTIKLHKVSKTGIYSDLIGTPTIPSSLSDLSGTSDLQAIEALAGTSGVLKKTAANTWALDTSTFFISNGNRGAIDFSTDYKTGFEYVSGSATNGSTAYAILFTATYGDAGMQVNFGRNTAMSYRNRTSGGQWSSWRTVYDTANANLSTIPWACSSLTANGDITATGTITPGSDARIKDNQKDILPEEAMDVVSRLKPKTWDWNARTDNAGKKAAGLVAQEVAEVVPEAVVVGEALGFKDFHSLNYNAIQGYEIAAIKGLIEEVKTLRKELAELKKTK